VASDNCSGVTLIQKPAAGISVSLGATTVTLTAQDAAGNMSFCTATVHVVYNTPPLLLEPMLSGGAFSLSIATVSCRSYVLEFKTDLSEDTWTALPAVQGDGTVKVLQDSSAAAVQRFYRVRVTD